MKLKFREPSAEARRAVCRSALYGEKHDPEARIRKVTGHRYARLLNSGNAASLMAQSAIDGLFIGRAAWEAESFAAIIEQILDLRQSRW